MMSAATRDDINGWLDRLYDDDSLSHMIVLCDTFDYSDYPVYVKKSENVREVAKEKASGSMTRLMEIYSRNHTREEQMAEYRAIHYD